MSKQGTTVLPVDRIKRWSFEEQRHPPSLRALRSDAKVFVVHVWGTWCQPCLEEFPLLKKMFPEGRGGDAQLILVALQSSEESLRKFAREHVAESATARSSPASTSTISPGMPTPI